MTDIRSLLIEQWREHPDATISTVEVCLAVSRATNEDGLADLQALIDEGRVKQTLAGLVLTDSGRELLLAEPEWWWIERDGRIEVARVTFGDAHAGLQDPQQPWHAEVVGSERIVWPTEARLVVAVIPLTRP